MNVLNKDKTQLEKGFTIIEVVLVLAIAGLIFLMVFIALPALQRNQRDTARKSDVSTVAAGVTQYTGNNRGTFPTTAQLASYTTDVSDNTTSVTVKTTAGAQTLAPEDGQIIITQKSKCGAATGESIALTTGTTRQYTVVTKLEGGGGAPYCQDS